MKHRLLPVICMLLILPQQTCFASALGQLEGLAGRSASSVAVPMPSRPTAVYSGGAASKGMAGAAAAGRASSALGALNLGMQILDIIDSMDAQSAANNANALQLQEQQRLEQERLRLLRQQKAEQLRSSWDQADAERSSGLDGMLDVPIQAGTAFFGTPANPGGTLPGQPTATAIPVGTGDTAPVATPSPSPAAARSVRQQRQTTTAMQESPQLTTELSQAHREILLTGAHDFSRKVTGDLLENALEKGIALLPRQWQVELMYEHQKKARTFIDELFTHLDAKRLVNTITHGTPAEMAQLEQEISRGVHQSAKGLVVSDDILQDEEPAFLLKLLRGEKVSKGEVWGMVKGRVYSAGIDATTDRLMFGGD